MIDILKSIMLLLDLILLNDKKMEPVYIYIEK